MIEANEIESTLLSMADERQAQMSLRFFKTGPGQYGEGDKFIGLRNPQVRMVVKKSHGGKPVFVKRQNLQSRLCMRCACAGC